MKGYLAYKPGATAPEFVPCDKRPSLEEMQKFVGGYIEMPSLPDIDGATLVCNEEGKIQRLPPSATLFYSHPRSGERTMYDVVLGPLMVLGGDHSCDAKKCYEGKNSDFECPLAGETELLDDSQVEDVKKWIEVWR